ncbi:hypothetical protein HB776_03545 [Tardiphaga robiniae]|uniref:Uncharacterized protein n=1 Tax=Tardiphaga robiniae TaxID=943830 RepID=A0A7G6TUI8_9BRAD|nr:hypothetical protein HB776_03545 [Tardiphaga robiniae]
MIRTDPTLNELLSMSWLVHLGVQHTMPDYRGIDVHRFSGEVDARDAAPLLHRWNVRFRRAKGCSLTSKLKF